ncbi:MAG: hypothetical protein ACTHZX_09535 [Microbacterium sp.]
MTGETVPRAHVVATAWRGIGDGVEVLSNAAGLPLARTAKLILDPLVVRPVQRPHLARTLLDEDAAVELSERIAAAADDLRATAAWFTRMKAQRRARRITEGNPQERYFQRAYELARAHGAPGERADEIAGGEVDDVHESAVVTAAQLRDFLADPGVARATAAEIAQVWRVRESAPPETDTERAQLARLLDACVAGAADAAPLEASGAGPAAGRRLDAPGAAREAGLSDRTEPAPPEVGAAATKNDVPRPFDRSILQRLFMAIAQLEVTGTRELRDLVAEEARRSGSPWQLAEERSRIVMAAGRTVGRMDDATEASRMLRARWEREGFVRHALRLGRSATDGASGAFLRRLWVRLQGRELRRDVVDVADLWDVLDGAMRSVILDRRDRVKAELTAAREDAPGVPA